MTEPHPTIRPQPGILDIALYVGGDSKLAGTANKVTKLSSNENPYGASPHAVEAYKAASADLALYPSTDHGDLRAAIGQVHGVDPARVICGAGSDEIIAFLCQVYAGVGDEVLYTEHGFAMYRISALAAGATPIEVREDNRHTDVDALLAACNDKTKLVFIANPNNPTGTMISGAEIARLAEGLPKQAILVLDGAYVEYVEDADFDAGLAVIEARDNVVMTRTFSKLYGLGGLRIGWGYGPAHIIDALNRVRGPFNLSGAALATAQAAVLDEVYTANCKALNTQWRGWLTEKLIALGLAVDESHGNFILVRFAAPELAEGCDAALRERGLIVRKVGGYGFPEGLRITIGDEIACRQVAQGVKEFLEGQGE